MTNITNHFEPGSCVFQAGSTMNGDVHITDSTFYQGKPQEGKGDAPSRLVPGPRKQFLFIEGDASWEEKGKQRNPSKENTVVRRREQDRFMKYLREHNLSSRELTTTQGDTLNDVVACFLVEWQRRGLVAKDFAGPAVWRFLKEECEMKSSVTAKAYGKEIKEWVDGKKFTEVMRRQVNKLFCNFSAENLLV